MTIIIWLMLLAGVLPLAAATVRQPPAWRPPDPAALAGSALLCTLAFNLTFFWQELWLVLAKALTPGLHPVLYHNNHAWTGNAPQAELLQGAGAAATLVSGVAFLAILMRGGIASGTLRSFVAWMAFEGLFQGLSQVALGALLPGNDMGRAFAWLGLGGAVRIAVLAAAVIGMAAAGSALARRWPIIDGEGGRAFLPQIAAPATIAVVLLIPFRLPRELVEVVVVPALVHLLGSGWTALGGTFASGRRDPPPAGPPGLKLPAAALLAVLAAFQLVLSRGIAL